MGNLRSKYDYRYTDPILSNIETHQDISTLQNDINRIIHIIDGFEHRVIILEKRVTEFSGIIDELRRAISLNYARVESTMNERIAVINKDMESLLNNDKLLLDKMIEKKMLSTIGESMVGESIAGESIAGEVDEVDMRY